MQKVQSNVFANISAMFFDLVDTLVRFDTELLPKMMIDGVEQSSTIPLMFEEVRAIVGSLSIETFLIEYIRARRTAAVLKAGTLAEVSAVAVFVELLRRLKLDDIEVMPVLAVRLAEAHFAALASAARLYDRAFELLARARQRGFHLALISNFDYPPAVDWILRSTGLAGAFDAAVISGEVGVRKPHEQLFRLALERTSVSAAAAIHVGDRAIDDIHGAHCAGLRTIWIRPPAATLPRGIEPPDLVVHTLTELDALVV
jgi:HAD superfamily hydrolase (TIGR01549 family)